MLGTKLVIAALVVWTALFLFVGLWPFKLHWPDQWHVHAWPSLGNGILNVVSFVPFGVLISLVPLTRSPILAAGLYCFALSLTVETIQMFVPGRYPSIADLVSNTAGGVLGAAVGARWLT